MPAHQIIDDAPLRYAKHATLAMHHVARPLDITLHHLQRYSLYVALQYHPMLGLQGLVCFRGDEATAVSPDIVQQTVAAMPHSHATGGRTYHPCY